MDLFSKSAEKRQVNRPLAERMRPVELAEFAGQEHLLGEGKLLAGIGKALPSLILWGPPGSGKTTLARLLASRTRAYFAAMSAVSSGVKDIREVVAAAAERRDQFGHPTILFLDEIHRFSKAQQDALLPHVEAGTVTLIGATTENPSFEVNGALLSRCRVVRLEPLAPEVLVGLARRAVADRERGLGDLAPEVADEALALLVERADGDARRMLNALEVAVHLAQGGRPAGGGAPARVEPAPVEEALQQRMLSYDRAGAEHYGVVSAFIKSMRGSDPDAAVYWMTRMLEAGEDPRFVVRRLVIFAAEDVGNADPQALVVATAALQAFELVGLPEGVLPLTQAAVYLACAPKSNTALTTYAAARKAVREHGALPVPKKLLNATTALDRQMGQGKGYKYPHEFAGHYVPEDYLPDALVGQRYYEPSDSGHEKEIGERLLGWRGARERSKPP